MSQCAEGRGRGLRWSIEAKGGFSDQVVALSYRSGASGVEWPGRVAGSCYPGQQALLVHKCGSWHSHRRGLPSCPLEPVSAQLSHF